MKHIITLLLLLLVCVSVQAKTHPRDTIIINSIEKLAKYAGKSDVLVKMKPGSYSINSIKIGKLSVFKYGENYKQRGDFRIGSLIHFSGNNSQYFLSGVTLNIDTKLHKNYPNCEFSEFLVSGNNNYIEGLTGRDIGEEVPAHRVQMLRVMGDDNTIKNADLFVQGSSPYGYGHLLGKGGNALVPLHKHSVLLVEGMNTKLLGCKVVTHAYGHGIFMQGAVNTYLENCYVEGKMRETNEMLAETSGPAFDVGFKSDYPPGKILPNEMKSLSEDGIRTYPDGGLNGRRTKGVIVINCTVKNMRSGFDLSANLPPTKIVGSIAIGCQEKGFSIGDNGIIENSKGDALYGPLITFVGNNIKNAVVDLELMDTVSDYKVSRLAEINGSGHQISIRKYQNKTRTVEAPIVFGESFWDDVHRYRNPDKPSGTYAGARNIKLINDTGMPVHLNDLAVNCTVSNSEEKNKVVNAGIGGNSTRDLLKRVDKDVLEEKPDVVIMMVGTNDMLNSNKMTDYKTYTSNLETLIEKIIASGSQLVVMTPIPADSTYLFMRHDKKQFTETPNQKLDHVGTIVKALSKKHSIYAFDLNAEFKALNLPQHNQDIFIKNEKNSGKQDGVHPTALGYRFIAEQVFKFLKSNELLKPNQRIICFGDSITRGGGQGVNYPSYLNELLRELY
ncbi:SGNH/GDSL hydrolase family protein [Formosa algae]|uniref:Lysophospholipase L1-like esterase n=1 Tax=Formosa algae TaxID=225843 RepID=A0A9X1CCL4_9FLAO|nr:GDSL-type esterase/lipase family protein [Formosa algae]MBP1841247.1 lysophospholipase L1-like esterase [Formosa algae]MDQ0336830.1 lysophospholipase L1-like esterase [Formosa algae]